MSTSGPAVIGKLKRHGGVPTILINGAPNSGVAYMTYWPKSGPLREFGEAGVHLYSFPSTCCHHLWEHMVPSCWLSPTHFEYSHLDRQIEQIVAADPEALIFPRVYLMSPRWWDQLHPDDLVTCDDGAGNYVPFYEVNQKRCPSWASEVWRRDTAESIRRYIQHVQASPYAEHVVGYHIASGTTEEWMYWGGNVGAYCDFSAANLRGFIGWLRERYGDNVAALRDAWGDPNASFEGVTIPNKAERLHTKRLYFRDPRTEGRVIDYHRYTSWMVADTICGFAQVVAEASSRQALCGVFYGYTLQLANSCDHRWQNAGHLALKRVLASPDIDFICSPSHYSARQLGEGGYSVFMSLTDSIKLHDKTWFDENDYRTFLARQEGHGKTNTLEDTIAVERRELANVLGNGVCMWWFDLSWDKWFSHPVLMGEIARHRQIAEESLNWDRRSVSEIGVLVDEETVPYLAMEREFPDWLIVKQLPQLGRLGAPFSLYLMDDLAQLTGDEHKLWILLNSFAPTEEHRRLIQEKLQRAGRTLLWLYAPGFIWQDRLSENWAERNPAEGDPMEALTGIRIRYAMREAPLKVRLGDGTRYGVDAPVGPVFWVEDEHAAVWGTLEGVEQPGLVVKEMPEWRSVYSAAPCLPAKLLRRLAAEAGVHIYTDQDDIVYGHQQLLGVCVDRGGVRTIRLPKTCDVYDLYEQRQVARGVTSFDIDLPAKQTGLYRLDTPSGA